MTFPMTAIKASKLLPNMERKQVLRNYDVGNTQTEDSVVFEVPEEWLNKEVKLYLENKEGINQQQKLACLFLSQDQGCKCRQSYLLEHTLFQLLISIFC